jgi:hypothetical protein
VTLVEVTGAVVYGQFTIVGGQAVIVKILVLVIV